MKLTKNLQDWKDYFKELSQSIIDYIKRDRTKDTKLVTEDLSNPAVSPFIITNPINTEEDKCPYPDTMALNDGCTMGSCRRCPAFTKSKETK